jgi:signal transduction histidine kinase
MKIMIQNLKTYFTYQCEKKDIYFKILIDMKDKFIKSDGNRIKQVIQNLLSNALKFARSKIFLVIEQTQAGFPVRVSVIDDGVGIKP